MNSSVTRDEPLNSWEGEVDVDEFRRDVEQAERDVDRAEQWRWWVRLLTLGLLDGRRRVAQAQEHLDLSRAQLHEYETLVAEARGLDALLLVTVELDGVRISKHTFADVSVLERARYPVDWDELRLEVLRRDGYQCQEYDGTCDGPLQIHHRRPLSRGGNNRLSNLVTLCLYHHCLKHPHMRAIYYANLRR